MPISARRGHPKLFSIKPLPLSAVLAPVFSFLGDACRRSRF